MLATTPGPGKTAPRLWADVREYDPLAKGRNTLCERPPQNFANGPDPHKHTWMGRSYVTNVLPTTYPPENNRVYQVVAICDECRLHLELSVDLSSQDLEVSPCPTEENQLHHLQYNPKQSSPIDVNYADAQPSARWEDIRMFVCSAKACPAVVTVTTRAPIIDGELKRLLTDKAVLSARTERFVNSPQNITPEKAMDLTPSKVLNTLVSYLKNVIAEDQRSIPAENTRFLNCFLDECDGIMRRAHFTSVRGSIQAQWKPPPLAEIKDLSSMTSRDIRDMLEEAMILFDRYKPWDATRIRHNLPRAEDDVKAILAFKDYNALSNWVVDLTTKEHPHYAGLGALIDFPDGLVAWAYQRQRECDPENACYYLDCLSGIAGGRNSEPLQIEVVTLKSQGEITTSDVQMAYKALDIDPSMVSIQDDSIVATFRSRLADTPAQEAHLRDALETVGKSRNSKTLREAARRTITDVASAYSWFQIPDGGRTVDDQYMIAVYNARVVDVPSDEGTAKEALRLIAETRQSNIILSFLESGAEFEPPFNLETAYARLGVSDESDEDIIITAYNIAITDVPSQFQDLRNALRVVAEGRDSIKIREYLQTGQDGQPAQTYQVPKGSAEWPVGLENIGNTCYLNSLLQFYFTIKPLREMVLDFEKYQEAEITDEVVKRKRVGGRKVTRREIERSKKFAVELRMLFQKLISAGTSYIRPERELAQLALFSHKDETEEIRRMSLAEPVRPIINLDDADDDRMDIDPKPSSAPEPADDASEATLVDDSMSTETLHEKDDDYIMIDNSEQTPRPDNKENLPPKASAKTDLLASVRPVLEDISANGEPEKRSNAAQAPLTPPPDYSEQPENPPPIPPRPQRQSTQIDINLDERRQQDVTECIGNVMFQLEAAIRPEQVDENGEQIDMIKNLFYGRTRQTLAFPNSAEMRTKEELFQNLIVNVADGDSDVYHALDEQFDVEQIELEGREAKRFLSIRELPPILQIQIQRVQFNRETGTAYKSDKQLSFPSTIFMDRYMDTEDQSLRVRREASWEWKAAHSALKARRDELMGKYGLDVATALEYTQEWLEDLDSTEDSMKFERGVLATLSDGAAAVRNELEAIEEKMKELKTRIDCQFTDLRKHGYRVHSVFIHSGTASGGHYWIYIYDFQKGIFRKYNDDHVDEVKDVQEVFSHANVQNPPTPYFMVFVREDQMANITEAVRRSIITSIQS